MDPFVLNQLIKYINIVLSNDEKKNILYYFYYTRCFIFVFDHFQVSQRTNRFPLPSIGTKITF